MKEKPQSSKVSVIVPCYNLAKYLPECLDSILRQTYSNFECIIINDGSTDETETVASDYTQKDSRIKLFSIDNGGLANARNTGIHLSDGDYILPLDADDKIDERYLEEAVRVLDENPNIQIVYCRANYYGKRSGEWKLHPYSLEYILASNCIFCSSFYRRSTYDKTLGYNPNMKYGYEDWDLWLSILEQGGDVYRIDKVLFYYRQRRRSMNTRILESDRIQYTRKQLYLNHKKLYSENFFNPELSIEYRHYAHSLEYKIGEIILKPLRMLYSIL